LSRQIAPRRQPRTGSKPPCLDSLSDRRVDLRGEWLSDTIEVDGQLSFPRIMGVFDPAIRKAAGHLLACVPDVESVPVGTPQNRSDNSTHVSILPDETS
jgi:hypothetical protein